MYAISCVAVGMGSFAMHGFNTGWGGWLDVTGMIMYISMPVFYNFSRFLRWSETEFISYYLFANAIFAFLLWQYSLLTFLWGALIGIWLSQELALKYQRQPHIIFLVPTSIIMFLYLYTSPGKTPIDFFIDEIEGVLLWGALAYFLYSIEQDIEFFSFFYTNHTVFSVHLFLFVNKSFDRTLYFSNGRYRYNYLICLVDISQPISCVSSFPLVNCLC